VHSSDRSIDSFVLVSEQSAGKEDATPKTRHRVGRFAVSDDGVLIYVPCQQVVVDYRAEGDTVVVKKPRVWASDVRIQGPAAAGSICIPMVTGSWGVL
jgi:hypothetical protein